MKRKLDVVVVVVEVVEAFSGSQLVGAGRTVQEPPSLGVVGVMPCLLLTALAYASLASCTDVTKSMIGACLANLPRVSNAHAWLDTTTMTPNCDGSPCTWFSWTCARRLEATIETIDTSTPSATDGPSMHRVMSWLQLLHPSTPPGLADTKVWCRSTYPPLAHFLWTTPTTRTICCCTQAAG